jgi:biotin synthase-like enzyme
MQENYSEGLQEMLEISNKTYLDNFPNSTCFERAIFFSWGCSIGDCKFCYMSVQPKEKLKEARRSKASILAETILCKELNWDIGFFTGGINILSDDELEFLLKAMNEIAEDKIWLSIGAISEEKLKRFAPYIKGVVGSVETVNPVLHDKICPSKPLRPYEEMFQNAIKLEIKRAMTFIVGMGETKEDLPLFLDFIKKNKIDKIHVYGFIPHVGTLMENVVKPSKEQESWWIAQFRINFPTLDIQCGIWDDRLDYIPMLLQAGSNSISKLKALKYFGTDVAKKIVKQSKTVRKEFTSEIIKIPNIDWNEKIDNLKTTTEELKQEVKEKLDIYLKQMSKNKLN